MYIGLHVKYPRFFKKNSNIIFHENLCRGDRVTPWGRIDRRTDMTKLIVTFRNFAIAPKMYFAAVSYTFHIIFTVNNDYLLDLFN